jgi:DNA-binding IclR family transcriptional regulator
MLRDEMVMRDRIAALLRPGPLTIPEIAARLGRPASEVVCWVMAMRRYGMVEEEGKPDADGYFSYALKSRAGNEGGEA